VVTSSSRLNGPERLRAVRVSTRPVLPAAILLFVLPGVLVVGILFVYPLLKIIGIAAGVASPASGPSSSGGFGWNPYVLKIAVTTLKLGFWTTAICLVLGYPVAYFLVRSRSGHRYLVFVAILTPLMVSIVVRTLGWIMVLGNDGLLNQILLGLRLIPRPVVWLYNFGATVLGLVHVLLPFMILSVMSGLAKVHEQVEESARILGASRWRTFVHVTLPLSMPGIFSGCALVFSLAMGAYVTPFLLGGGKVQVLATQIYAQMLEIVDWRTGSALSLYLATLTLLVLAAYRLVVRKVEAYRGE
jgi:putative spermidine/putrescine transport system permease protein